MKPLRFAVLGTGFWSNYQIAAWKEVGGVELVAVYNRTIVRGQAVADKFGVSKVYDNVEELLEKENLDFVDIITDVDSHKTITLLAAAKGIPIICQKPMAASLSDANDMVKACEENKVSFFVHENFRWQAPIRAVKKVLDKGLIGTPFKARVSFCSAFPVFDNQPFLAELEKFIITDIGSHILDVCRFLFGEIERLCCFTQTVNKKIRGEDVANVLMEMKSGLHCFAEMSYASILENEVFPQTLILVEGDQGSIHLDRNFELKVTDKGGTVSSRIEIPFYTWADPAYAVVHSSIVECNRDLLNGLLGGKAETTGQDNLRTVRAVWACYDSAALRNTVQL